MIYSPRAQPKVNESHISTRCLIFHMGEVLELWRRTMVNMFFFIVLKSRPVFRSQKLRKQTSRQEFQNSLPMFSVWATVQ